MRKNSKTRFAAFAMAFALIVTALPAVALAGDGNIIAFDGTGIVDTTETEYLAIAAGHPGDSISIYVPVKNVGGSTATDMTCEIPVSGNPDTFPFVNDNETTASFTANPYQKVDSSTSKLKKWSGDELLDGEHAYFKLDITILPDATSGYKTLTFNVNYSYGGASCTDTVEVTLYVRPVEASTGSSGSSYKSKPKVIIESYEFTSDTIYAGDTVTLRLVVANTSSREAITNLTLDLSDESGAVMPAPGGSSSIYIGTIDKQSVYAFSIDLQISPDAESKSHLLTMTLAYEGTKNRQEFEETASLNVPVTQHARVRINDPVVYDDPWIGSSVSVGVTLYNLGKSPLYNCLVDLEDNENLTLEESYFGGNVAAGGTMRADLTVTPLVGGEVTGNLRVTYEDVYGNQTEQLLPLDLMVNDDATVVSYASGSNAMYVDEDSSQMQAGGGVAWYWWVLGAAVVIAGLVVLGIRAKKKRERELEDL